MEKERLERYSRHIVLDEVGLGGQIRLANSTITIVGAGGLGSPALLYLAAAGIGKIRVIDDDVVDESNLQRQVIHSETEVGKSKVKSARRRLSALDSKIVIESIEERVCPENAERLLGSSDVVIDGTDSFEARYSINDACESLGIPWVFASVLRFEGQVSVFNYENGPNYRDLFPDPPPPELAPSCADAGVLGAITGILGSIQAAEAIKILLGIGETLSGRLLILDAMTMKTRILQIGFPEKEETEDVTQLRANNSISPSIQPIQLKSMIDDGVDFFLLDVRRADEESIASIEETHLRIEHFNVPSRIDELPLSVPIVVYCHSGVRSASVVRYLGSLPAFDSRVSNLVGGIDLWSREIDQNIPRY
ncbi:MAG: molybdopterin-synthase adenylyltransferase MoeB [Candidatus Thalassarchaeaceae archaeon]